MVLDGNDIKILAVLQSNGRLSFRQAAEKVKISVPTVSHKVGVLEKLGIIKGYAAQLDPERLGEMSAVVIIKARPSELSAVGERFLEDEAVRQMFYLSSGRLMLICTFPEAHLINGFASLLSEIPEVMEYEIANVIGVSKEEPRAIVVPGINACCAASSADARCGKSLFASEREGRTTISAPPPASTRSFPTMSSTMPEGRVILFCQRREATPFSAGWGPRPRCR